jgi:hypothetical protein
MVRLDSKTIVLILANLVAFIASGFIGFDADIQAVKQEGRELEKSFPKQKEIFAWASGAKAAINSPPEADVGQLFGRWTQMATRLGLDVGEAAQITNEIPEVKLAATGAFDKIAMICNNIGAEKAALVKRIRFEQVDEQSWEIETNVAIRSGPWKYYPTQERSPVPNVVENYSTAINSGKPFATTVRAPVKVPIRKENIRYIGYFSEQATPSVIIEVAGKFAVMKCGEKTPGGAIIKGADAEELKLGKTDNTGKEAVWTVKMEKK